MCIILKLNIVYYYESCEDLKIIFKNVKRNLQIIFLSFHVGKFRRQHRRNLFC